MKPSHTSVKQDFLDDYWKLRENYLAELKGDRELKKEHRKRIAIYLLRKLLWSFGFFPIFLAIWIPLLLSHFNLVIFSQQLIELFNGFLSQPPNLQAATSESLVIAWASIGCMFMVFDLVLTPYRSPYQEQADSFMKARYMMFSDMVERRNASNGAIHNTNPEVVEHDARPVYPCEDDVDEEMMVSTHISIGNPPSEKSPETAPAANEESSVSDIHLSTPSSLEKPVVDESMEKAYKKHRSRPVVPETGNKSVNQTDGESE